MAAGEVENECVQRGAAYLIKQFNEKDMWVDKYFNAVGFPKVFYLKYYGYSFYFPLLALARYNKLKNSNCTIVKSGI